MIWDKPQICGLHSAGANAGYAGQFALRVFGWRESPSAWLSWTLTCYRMPNPLDSIKINGTKLETPFTIRQVESHLIFGPISRHVPTAYIALGGAIISLIAGFFATGIPVGQYIGSIFNKLIFLVVPLLLLRMTYANASSSHRPAW